MGGGLGLLFAILLGIVNVFLMPAEVGNLYAGGGQEKPVHGPTGFWALIPIVGGIIWVIKTQGALSRLGGAWRHGDLTPCAVAVLLAVRQPRADSALAGRSLDRRGQDGNGGPLEVMPVGTQQHVRLLDIPERYSGVRADRHLCARSDAPESPPRTPTTTAPKNAGCR